MLNHPVERYMKIDCACFTPTNERMEHVGQMAKDLEVDGVVHYALQFCPPYTIESFLLERALKQANIPVLKIETDYSNEDTETLKNRVEAFLEMIR